MRKKSLSGFFFFFCCRIEPRMIVVISVHRTCFLSCAWMLDPCQGASQEWGMLEPWRQACLMCALGAGAWLAWTHEPSLTSMFGDRFPRFLLSFLNDLSEQVAIYAVSLLQKICQDPTACLKYLSELLVINGFSSACAVCSCASHGSPQRAKCCILHSGHDFLHVI